MELIDSLKFVKNAYAKTDLIPGLTHFVIRNQRITAFNGMLAASCPIALDFDVAPHAGHFYKCIDACEDAITLTVDKSKLKIKSGAFKAVVDCVDYSEVPTIFARGNRFPLTAEIIPTLKKLLRFLEEDNPKDFANGILFKGGSMFATNGKVLLEAYTGNCLPIVNIPKRVLMELCRNDEEPEAVCYDESMIYFMLPNDRWIASKTLTSAWPNLDPILSRPASPTAPASGLWDALARLNRFADEAGRCYFKGSQVSTHLNTDKEGASIDCEGLPEKGIYNSKELVKLKDIAAQIDFNAYPDPVLFFGDKIRGALVGYTQ